MDLMVGGVRYEVIPLTLGRAVCVLAGTTIFIDPAFVAEGQMIAYARQAISAAQTASN